MDQAKADEIASARQKHADSHLLLGLLCAREVALDEAVSEMELAAKLDASGIAGKLLEAVRTMRAGPRTPSQKP